METPRGLPLYKQRCDAQLSEVIERLRISLPAVPSVDTTSTALQVPHPPATASAASPMPKPSEVPPGTMAPAPQRSRSDLSSTRSSPMPQQPQPQPIEPPKNVAPLPAATAEAILQALGSQNASPLGTASITAVSPSMSQMAEHVLAGSLPSSQQATPAADLLQNEPLTNAQRITLETLVIMELHGNSVRSTHVCVFDYTCLQVDIRT